MQLKTWLQITIYEIDFHMILQFVVAQNLVAEHYERDFITWFTTFKAAQKLVVEYLILI